MAEATGTGRARLNFSLFFPAAQKPDMVRAAQKDLYYGALFHESCREVLIRLYGARFCTRRANEISSLASLIYNGCCTVFNKPTLGEEYCSIMQISEGNRLPGLARRMSLLFWQFLFPYLYWRGATRASRWLREAEARGAGMNPTAPLWQRSGWFLIDELPDWQSFRQTLRRANLALFYLTDPSKSPVYYHIGKRIAGIRYTFNGEGAAAAGGEYWGYRSLGFLLGFELAVSTLMSLFATARKVPKLFGSESAPSTSSSDHNRGLHKPSCEGKCILCLSERTNTTATQCGHLFCWDCICGWCATKAECPLCRQPVNLRELICVYNR